MTMDYSPCPEREIWPFLKCSNISETGETTPTKTGVHALDIDPYLHDFFQPILINSIFLMTMDYSPCPEREIWPFLKGNHISETGETMPTKTDVHARDIDPYLHEFFEPILID